MMLYLTWSSIKEIHSLNSDWILNKSYFPYKWLCRENLIRYQISRFPITSGHYNHPSNRSVSGKRGRRCGKEIERRKSRGWIRHSDHTRIEGVLRHTWPRRHEIALRSRHIRLLGIHARASTDVVPSRYPPWEYGANFAINQTAATVELRRFHARWGNGEFSSKQL